MRFLLQDPGQEVDDFSPSPHFNRTVENCEERHFSRYAFRLVSITGSFCLQEASCVEEERGASQSLDN